jgi:hypothetical protein
MYAIMTSRPLSRCDRYEVRGVRQVRGVRRVRGVRQVPQVRGERYFQGDLGLALGAWVTCVIAVPFQVSS